MSIFEMEAKARELKELKMLREELDAEITAVEDQIKTAMGDRESVIAGIYKITWKPVESTRLDTTSLKAVLPDIAARFMVKSVVRRFTVQ